MSPKRAARGGSWTRVEDVVETLAARWDRGAYLRAYAGGEAWAPVSVPLSGPKADDLLNDPDAVVRWAEQVRSAGRTVGGRERFAIEYRSVRSRALGANEVPARIRVDTLDQLVELLGTAADVDAVDRVLATTRREVPALVPWVCKHPREAIANRGVWDLLLDTVRWIRDHDMAASDVRHLDVAGVDTKFVERHRKVLGRLLDQVLPPERIDPDAKGFAGRYGFRRRPSYVRLRLLAPFPQIPAALTELEVRADELARTELPLATVFVVENKASYLAFPKVANAAVVYGGGFAVTVLEAVPWLAGRELVYWGDIDTHGFAILDRLRERVPSVRSILMDRDTLVAHLGQVVAEANPTSAPLGSLSPEEADLYRDLVEDRYGTNVRLEQERIRFSLVRQALEPWTSARPPVTGPGSFSHTNSGPGA